MNVFLDLLAMLLFLTGFIFLAGAVIGVIRFQDPLQRMHASTKAGTLGAILSVLAAVVAIRDALTVTVGLLTVLFLLLTVPVSAHVLGRGIYISGARFVGEKDRDALAGSLQRNSDDGDGPVT